MFTGGELLPAAPLQPCAGAPSGRGHLFSGWVTWPLVIFSSTNVLLAVQAWGTPSAWHHVPRPPIRWVSSGRWVISEPCQYISCPLLPTTSSRVFSAHHNINDKLTYHEPAIQSKTSTWSAVNFNKTCDLNEL